MLALPVVAEAASGPNSNPSRGRGGHHQSSNQQHAWTNAGGWRIPDAPGLADAPRPQARPPAQPGWHVSPPDPGRYRPPAEPGWRPAESGWRLPPAAPSRSAQVSPGPRSLGPTSAWNVADVAEHYPNARLKLTTAEIGRSGVPTVREFQRVEGKWWGTDPRTGLPRLFQSAELTSLITGPRWNPNPTLEMV
jgi:hypothetical protein